MKAASRGGRRPARTGGPTRQGRRAAAADRRHLQATAALGIAVLVAFTTSVLVLMSSSGADAPTASLPSSDAPRSFPSVVLTAVVHDAGPSGLTLRATPSTDPAAARGAAPDGAVLPVVCGASGPSVALADGTSPTWLRTSAGLFAPALFARVADRPTIANCVVGQPDLDLLPTARPSPLLAPPGPTSSAPRSAARETASNRSSCRSCSGQAPARTPAPRDSTRTSPTSDGARAASDDPVSGSDGSGSDEAPARGGLLSGPLSKVGLR